MMDAGRGREGTSYGRTPEADRYLGVGQGHQRGAYRTREASNRIVQGNPHDGRHVREAQTSGGGQLSGALYRWIVAPLPGEIGGEKWLKKERQAALTGEK